MVIKSIDDTSLLRDIKETLKDYDETQPHEMHFHGRRGLDLGTKSKQN